jgi:hypothetical protein
VSPPPAIDLTSSAMTGNLVAAGEALAGCWFYNSPQTYMLQVEQLSLKNWLHNHVSIDKF